MRNLDKKDRPGRRDFLRKVAVTGGSAAALAVAGNAVAAPAETVAEKPTEDAIGYQETDHVRSYYRTCRS